MAPILATATGVPLPPLDGPLQSLLDALNGALKTKKSDPDGGPADPGAADAGSGNRKIDGSRGSAGEAYDDEDLSTILQDQGDIFFEEQVRLGRCSRQQHWLHQLGDSF